MGKKVKVDLSGVEAFTRVSEGQHAVKVATSEMRTSQGGNDMISVVFEVIGNDPDKGGRVYENFPLVDTALWKLKGFLQSIGMKADGKVQIDLDKLIGKVCDINVVHEEYEGKIRARVESIMKHAVPEDGFEDDDDDDEPPFDDDDDEEEEEKLKKKDKAAKKKPAPEEDEDDEDEDDEDEEEPMPKPKKDKAASKKEEKKVDKKSKKKEEPEEDDDDNWDDDDWDE